MTQSATTKGKAAGKGPQGASEVVAEVLSLLGRVSWSGKGLYYVQVAEYYLKAAALASGSASGSSGDGGGER